MCSRAEQVETVGAMAAQEALIAELYRAYAGQLPQHRQLLEALAREEVDHARMITGFVEKVRAGGAQVNPGRFSSQSILTSLEYVREKLGEAGKGTVGALQALSTCLDLEEALIEKQYFEIVEGDGPELKQVLQCLAADTARHRDRLPRAWEAERGQAR